MSKSPNVEMLDSALEVQRMQRAQDWPHEKFFNLFAADCVMKVLQPSDEELIEGLVDGSMDCGIDALYVVINESLLGPGFKYDQVGAKPHIQLVLIQAKTSTGFSEDGPIRIASYLPRLLDPKRSDRTMHSWCNPQLRSASRRFLDAYSLLLPKFPTVSVLVYYASKGENVHPNVAAKQGDLTRAVHEHFPAATVALHFFTAANLLDSAREDVSSTYELTATHQPLSTPDGRSYLCLVSLQNYRVFLTSESGGLNQRLFESNVRDWEGRTDINEEILSTLEGEPTGLDFWWLNNGVTLVASAVVPHGHSLVLENAQIVNGLQTSTQLYRAKPRVDDDRSVLVRVIQPPSTETRDQVIRATNNQHELSSAALRATERTQRNVEDYFLQHGYFYERRKNHYKNLGKPISNLVTMQGLAQADASAFLQRPHTAYKDPISLLSDDGAYAQMFGSLIPLKAHLRSVQLLNVVTQGILGQSLKEAALDDLRYHLTTVVAILLTGRPSPGPDDIAAVDPSRLDPHRIRDIFPLVAAVMLQTSGNQRTIRPIEDMAQDPAVTQQILDQARPLLRFKAWQQWPERPVEDYFHLPSRRR